MSSCCWPFGSCLHPWAVWLRLCGCSLPSNHRNRSPRRRLRDGRIRLQLTPEEPSVDGLNTSHSVEQPCDFPAERERHLSKQAGLDMMTAPEHCYIWQASGSCVGQLRHLLTL